MPFDKVRLSERIYVARAKKGFKQSEVYKKLNLHQSAYSDIENGKRTPDIPLLYQIAEILDVSVPWLLSEDIIPDLTDSECLELEKYKQYLISIRKRK